MPPVIMQRSARTILGLGLSHPCVCSATGWVVLLHEDGCLASSHLLCVRSPCCLLGRTHSSASHMCCYSDWPRTQLQGVAQTGMSHEGLGGQGAVALLRAVLKQDELQACRWPQNRTYLVRSLALAGGGVERSHRCTRAVCRRKLAVTVVWRWGHASNKQRSMTLT